MNSREVRESGYYGKGKALCSLPHDYEEDEYDFEAMDDDEGYDFSLTEPYEDDDDETRASFVIAPNGDLKPGVIYTKEQVEAMTFASEIEAFDWYNLYALMLGFGIRRCNRRYFDPETKELTKSRIFVCARQGVRSDKWKYMENRKREHTRNTRCLCKARIRIKRTSPTEPFTVDYFQPEHSHTLSDPQCRSMHRSHRKVTESDIEHIRSLKEVGIKYCQGFLLMVKQSGGYANVPYTQKDMYNKMASLDKLYSNEGDGQQTLKFIDSLEKSHHGVFKRFILGSNQELQSLFWCDRRSQEDYKRFGDVLIFDATYKANMYRKPLVILSGVNNHFQNTVFAFAVVHDEKKETYEWVLSCLMEAMENKMPVSVITDGDLAMKSAIQKIFPHAKHRLCSWHLCRNAEGKLKKGAAFISDFKKCMHSRKPENFWFEDWQAMVERWDLSHNHWIQVTYLARHMWAETYLKFFFFAGQTTTSRCESVNSFFKDFVSYMDKLVDLCRGLMTRLGKLRKNEREEHFKSDQSDPICTTRFRKLEKHAAEVFTNNIFLKFKHQAEMAEDYRVTKVIPIEESKVDQFYVMRGEIKHSVQIVQCTRSNRGLCCTCFKFETSKMICKHMILVLKEKGVNRIPTNLIADRWVKTDKKFYATEPSMKEPIQKSCDDPAVQASRRGAMKSQVTLYTSLGCRSFANYKYWKDHMADGIRTMTRMCTQSEEGTHGGVKKEDNPYSHVKNPNPPDTKHPKGPKQDKRRRCGNCKELGHNRTTCPNPPVDSYEEEIDAEDD